MKQSPPKIKAFLLPLSWRIAFLLWGISVNSWAQWNIFYYKDHYIPIADFASANSNYSTGHLFFQQTGQVSDSVIHGGVAPFVSCNFHYASGLGIGNATKFWSLDLNSLLVNPQKTIFYFNFSSKNVQFYWVVLTDNTGRLYKKKFALKNDDYQLANESLLIQWEGLRDSTRLKKLEVLLEPKDSSLPCDLIVGELKLLQRESQREEVKGYFFDELKGKEKYNASGYTIDNWGTAFPIKSFTIFRSLGAQSIFFQADSNASKESVQKNTLDLIESILGRYPYFKEHDINKDAYLTFLQKTIHSNKAFEEKLLIIDSLFGTLYDGHFHFQHSKEQKVNSPIVVKVINGVYQIVGVFNDDIKKSIQPGDKLLAIDGNSIENTVGQNKQDIYGPPAFRSQQNVSKSLQKAASDSTTITIAKENGNIVNVTFSHARPPIIPENFKPQHGLFRNYGSTVYFRLNSWEMGDWIRFYSHKDELKKAKEIIFDLRGNSGGADVEAYRIFSCFINKPVKATKSTYSISTNNSIAADNIIIPNQHLTLLGKKVYILSDNKTACASELFIALMKTFTNAAIVGSEPSSGSYSSGETFYLPFNITLKCNILTQFHVPGKDQNIEFKGIRPDIFVPIDSYQDLYPYNDKVLSTTLLIAEKHH
ncbi:S41 family peptidase [Niabella sp.]|uniref:S41 family peptidase n=1 Tax=Niabella sp. TaxID=1962976 RepID=UPI0026282AC7|nr:S41 family peptidase [Niabella sp.]